jgi:hypothetical protein
MATAPEYGSGEETSQMKLVRVPVPRALLVVLALGVLAMLVQELPALLRELKILRM